MHKPLFFLWRLSFFLTILSNSPHTTAQGGYQYPAGVGKKPPTPPQPGTVAGQPVGPEFKDIATEKLLLKPLKDGKVSTHFEFEYLNKNGVPRDPRTLGSDDKGQHYEFFPLAMGQILREYAVAEMHLTLNSGRWRYDTWGYPENAAVGTGAELWAWMADGGPVSTEERWVGLSNALAGLFCASLSSLPQQRTTSPSHSFTPEGQLPLYSSPHPLHSHLDSSLPYKLYHAILPSENICTENLTPFVKLLPCKNYAGVSELLNPHKLFGGYWYGVGIHATWSDGLEEEAGEEEIVQGAAVMGKKAIAGKYQEPGKEKEAAPEKKQPKAGIKLKLTVGAVLDPVKHKGELPDNREWTLEGLFGKNITRICAVTNKADVQVLAPLPSETTTAGQEANPAFQIHPPPQAKFRVGKTWKTASVEGVSGFEVGKQEWDVVRVKKDGLNLTVSENGLHARRETPTDVPLSITRSLRGSDQTRGGIVISITNHLSTDVTAWYVESIPWVIKPYLSTLRVEDVQYLSSRPADATNHGIFEFSETNYVSAPSRTESALLEIPLILPARSTIRLSFEFEKAFLKYTEHPPDAQRGWDLPGGVLIPAEPNAASGKMPRMYTSPLLADLATPDFSMPYNVIILSGALIALLFGMMFNMLMRKFVLVKGKAE